MLQPNPEATPLYLLHLPHCLLLPLILLGLPIRYLSAPLSSVRRYGWGAAVLGASLAGAWSVAALVDPTAASAVTQWGLVVGWGAGGTIYEGLLLWLLSRAQ